LAGQLVRRRLELELVDDGREDHGRPLESLTRLRSLVDGQGYLAIEVPQWRSAGRIVRRSRWAQLRPPEHINFFTRSSLSVALRSSGWSLVHSSTPYPRAKALALEAFKKRDLRHGTVRVAAMAVDRAGFGGYLRALARPV